MALALTPGLMENLTPASGRTITCLDKEFLCGLMAGGTKVNMYLTKRKVSEFTHGRTTDNTQASGKTVSNTDKEYTEI